MYLHGPGELAEVKNLGFAVSPGTHTLIGIKLDEVGIFGYAYLVIFIIY